jgi:hypothetical protein
MGGRLLDSSGRMFLMRNEHKYEGLNKREQEEGMNETVCNFIAARDAMQCNTDQ